MFEVMHQIEDAIWVLVDEKGEDLMERGFISAINDSFGCDNSDNQNNRDEP